MHIKKIYVAEDLPTVEEGIPAEQPGTTNEVLDYALLNTDVIVQLDDGNTYKANFISLKKLVEEFQTHQKNVESLGQKYFWSKNMVIVNNMGEKELAPIIEYMIEEGDFQMIFEKLT